MDSRIFKLLKSWWQESEPAAKKEFVKDELRGNSPKRRSKSKHSSH